MRIDLAMGVQYGMVPKVVTVTPEVPRSAKVVFLALATYADTTGECRPSQSTLARDLDATREFVTRWIGWLVQNGWVERIPQGRADDGRRVTNHYSLRPAWERERQRVLHVSAQSPGDHRVTRGVIEGSHGPGDSTVTENTPGGNTPQNTVQRPPMKVGRKVVTTAERELAVSILAEFNRQAGTRYASEDHLRPIIGRLREHPQYDLPAHGRLIRAQLAEPWWSGPPGPQVIYGNAAQFERSVEVARAAKHRTPLSAVQERPKLTRDEATLRDLRAYLDAAPADERAQVEADIAAVQARIEEATDAAA